MLVTITTNTFLTLKLKDKFIAIWKIIFYNVFDYLFTPVTWFSCWIQIISLKEMKLRETKKRSTWQINLDRLKSILIVFKVKILLIKFYE